MKISTDRRQTSWLFTQRRREIELGATEDKSSEWQGGGLEPETTRLQDHHRNHSATPPRVTLAIDALSIGVISHFGLLVT